MHRAESDVAKNEITKPQLNRRQNRRQEINQTNETRHEVKKKTEMKTVENTQNNVAIHPFSETITQSPLILFAIFVRKKTKPK